MFIHGWALGLFHFLAVVSRAAVNITVQIFAFSVLLGIYLAMGLPSRKNSGGPHGQVGA